MRSSCHGVWWGIWWGNWLGKHRNGCVCTREMIFQCREDAITFNHGARKTRQYLVLMSIEPSIIIIWSETIYRHVTSKSWPSKDISSGPCSKYTMCFCIGIRTTDVNQLGRRGATESAPSAGFWEFMTGQKTTICVQQFIVPLKLRADRRLVKWIEWIF